MKILFIQKILRTLVLNTACIISLLPAIFAQNSTCFIDINKPGAPVANICRGQQLEEFNHQFQGGLYAQLINNPSFEELKNPIAQWFLVKNGSSAATLSFQSSKETKMLNNNQEHCLKLAVLSGSAEIANEGYWGIKLENGIKYKISFWAKAGSDYKGNIEARLESKDGQLYAKSQFFHPSGEWKHFTCELIPKGIGKTSGNNRFVIYASAPGDLYFDVVTMMPPTWKNRANGLRPDLAAELVDLKLKYIQFPGGCTSESANMDTCWNWKNSIGPLEQRKGETRNRWRYKNDLYFGLDEYLQLCEDLGAEAVYTSSAGISESPAAKGWWGLCPLDKMQPIVEDILDLIQYCNGSTSTKWGAVRSANGHPKPYHLKYLEIGNENGWETIKEYNPRYSMIHDSILAHFPYMKIMYNGSRQEKVHSHTSGLPVDYTDEHFYLKDLSIMYDKYDSIDPDCKKICVAEYATSIKGNGGKVTGNYGDALGDAVFMLGCEKNSQRIWWTGYGNYAGVVDHSDFGPCIVWNDAVSYFCSPSYYMQKMMFADNQGTQILPFKLNSKNCYCSASLDDREGKKEVLLKVVNISGEAETIKIDLDGAGNVNPKGKYTQLTGMPDDENSLSNPRKIFPVYGVFEAKNSFHYNFPAYSITVLRFTI